jgi:hypothetical protein
VAYNGVVYITCGFLPLGEISEQRALVTHSERFSEAKENDEEYELLEDEKELEEEDQKRTSANGLIVSTEAYYSSTTNSWQVINPLFSSSARRVTSSAISGGLPTLPAVCQS